MIVEGRFIYLTYFETTFIEKGLYGFTGWIPILFIRNIYITVIIPPDKKKYKPP